MTLLGDPGAVLNIASGALMGVLGIALLVTNPKKDWNRLFGLLAFFWGAQIASINTVRLTTDADTARFAGELSLAFLIPLYFFVVSFAAVFPRPRGPFGTRPWAVALLALPAGAALAALFASPGQLIERVQVQPNGTYTMLWGELFPYLVTAPFFGAVAYALYTMLRRLEDASSAIERKQITFVLAAIGLYVAYYAPVLLVKFGGAALGVGEAAEAAGAETALIALIMAGTVAVLAVVAVKLARRTRDPTAPAGREARAALYAVGGAALAALAIEALDAAGGPRLDLLGLVRSGSVVLIVYAIARYQLFDIDLKAKHGTVVLTTLVAVVAVGAALWVALRETTLPPSAGTAVAALVALAAFWPMLRLAARLADRLAPQVSAAGDHLYLRKLEVYRAAVEDVLARGEPARPEEAGLAALRAELGLGEREHGIVVTLASTRAEPRAARTELAPGSVAFGKYTVEEVLAQGGFGRVLLARDRLLERPVVIKELLAKWRENERIVQTFLREAQIAGQLDHPNIVSVYGVERQADDHFVIMEYLAGGSLEERLGDGPLAPAEAVRVAVAVLDALEAAHARGVVHRDVKAANVLFGARGEVKLADFGIAHLTSTEPQRTISGLTTDGFQPGTLVSMSPEQARGQRVDARSDLYAVGALLYRMLSGRPHVEVDGLDELSARNRVADAESPAPLEDVPDGLNAVMARALQRDADDRYGGAGEMRAVLLGVGGLGGVPRARSADQND